MPASRYGSATVPDLRAQVWDPQTATGPELTHLITPIARRPNRQHRLNFIFFGIRIGAQDGAWASGPTLLRRNGPQMAQAV